MEVDLTELSIAQSLEISDLIVHLANEIFVHSIDWFPLPNPIESEYPLQCEIV